MAKKASLGKSLLKSGKSNKKTLLVLTALAAAIGVYVVFGASAATSSSHQVSWRKSQHVTIGAGNLYKVKNYNLQWVKVPYAYGSSNSGSIVTTASSYRINPGPGEWRWQVRVNYCIDPACSKVGTVQSPLRTGAFTIPAPKPKPDPKPPKDKTGGSGSGTRRVTGSTANRAPSAKPAPTAQSTARKKAYSNSPKVFERTNDLIGIQWFNNPNNFTVKTYKVYRFNPRAADAGWRLAAAPLNAATTEQKTRDGNLLPDHKYYYQVCAYNAAGAEKCGEIVLTSTKR